MIFYYICEHDSRDRTRFLLGGMGSGREIPYYVHGQESLAKASWILKNLGYIQIGLSGLICGDVEDQTKYWAGPWATVYDWQEMCQEVEVGEKIAKKSMFRSEDGMANPILWVHDQVGICNWGKDPSLFRALRSRMFLTYRG